MKPVHVVQGTAVPLDRSDVDTDQIIPAEWLKRVERTGFGRGLFSTWRDDRDFVLNDESYAGATILVAGPNFGTGSSREHAVWAIMDYGFEAVPVLVPADVGDALLRAIEADPGLELTIDVERRTLSAPAVGIECSFPLDDATRERFLQGLDDIGITLRDGAAIDAFESTRPAWLPNATG
jgi:3-isopropylmalate/(R)-2-methylmalate dehydratase small subunit